MKENLFLNTTQENFFTKKEISDFLKQEGIQNIQSHKIQEGLNKYFTEQRRNEILKSASLDKKGHQIRLYRHISFEMFQKFINEEYQDPKSFQENSSHKIDLANLKRDFKDYLIGSIPDIYKKEKWEEKRNVSLEEVLEQNFNKEAGDFLKNKELTLDVCVEFSQKFLDPEYIKLRHTGSMQQKFSPYLSLSVGGIIRPLNNNNHRVYLELSIPKENIIPNFKGVTGEKEVFVNNISLSETTKVFIDNPEMEQDFNKKENITSLGSFIKNNEYRFFDQAINDWRWGVKTEDCLFLSPDVEQPKTNA